jgi:hypothetical protein
MNFIHDIDDNDYDSHSNMSLTESLEHVSISQNEINNQVGPIQQQINVVQNIENNIPDEFDMRNTIAESLNMEIYDIEFVDYPVDINNDKNKFEICQNNRHTKIFYYDNNTNDLEKLKDTIYDHFFGDYCTPPEYGPYFRVDNYTTMEEIDDILDYNGFVRVNHS